MTFSSRTQLQITLGVRILLALVFGIAGIAKLAGVAAMIEIFSRIGLGQGFRYVTGLIEVVGAIMLLVPSTSLPSAFVLNFLMNGAILIHMTVIGGNPVPAMVLATLTGYLATRLWPTRNSSVLSKFPMLARML